MKLLLLLIPAMLVALPAGAQDANKAGTTAAQFLKIGVGARSMGMAGASAGITDDASAMYWNPSGMIGVSSITVYATHSNWFADISHQFFGVVLPLGDDHRIGLNATLLSMGDIEVTTEQEPRGTGTFFKASDVAVGISYAGRLVDFFSFGVTVKYITQSIYNETGSAIAVDLGTTLHTGYKGITVGMAFSNFGTTMQLEGRDLHRTFDPNPNNATNTGVSSDLATESWDLPVNFRVGIGWELVGATQALFTDEGNRVRFAVDANHPNDGPEHASTGIEYTWQDIVSLRSGYHFNDDLRSWSYGLGLSWGTPGAFAFGLDYAFSDMDRLGGTHVFSLGVRF
ncbi:MAG: PorV/PorQ family protein [Ignavibacteria bacterium]|nr:PorV/PorQ family protein [Ignavibacteria bacterium]